MKKLLIFAMFASTLLLFFAGIMLLFFFNIFKEASNQYDFFMCIILAIVIINLYLFIASGICFWFLKKMAKIRIKTLSNSDEYNDEKILCQKMMSCSFWNFMESLNQK